jgi:hypothetical protein
MTFSQEQIKNIGKTIAIAATFAVITTGSIWAGVRLGMIIVSHVDHTTFSLLTSLFLSFVIGLWLQISVEDEDE